jgi:hypothetical protein
MMMMMMMMIHNNNNNNAIINNNLWKTLRPYFALFKTPSASEEFLQNF